MEWEAPVNETEMVLDFFQIGTKPFQPYIRCYNFLPPPDKRNFALQQEDLDRTIDNFTAINSLKNGFLHKDGRRVTINYTSGGVLTFELAERAPYIQASKWQG